MQTVTMQFSKFAQLNYYESIYKTIFNSLCPQAISILLDRPKSRYKVNFRNLSRNPVTWPCRFRSASGGKI